VWAAARARKLWKRSPRAAGSGSRSSFGSAFGFQIIFSKIKNHAYSQAIGREDFFDRRMAAAK
jgi:hypothetical protein